MRVLQINSVVNTGSTGRIAEEIGNVLIDHGHESYIAYGRGRAKSNSHLIKIGSNWDVYLHGAYTLLTDRHGFASRRATENLIEQIESLKPDLIALHNLHGYYINNLVLFKFLKNSKIPLVWTFHDCWPFTGHCTYFEHEGCFKWRQYCEKCPKTTYYPKSLVIDNSKRNFNDKKELFSELPFLNIITPSRWLAKYVKESFLGHYPTHIIHNGINLDKFKPSENSISPIIDTKYILGVANVWSSRKGILDFVKIRENLEADVKVVLVGLSEKEMSDLPKEGFLGIPRTESIEQLAALYTNALCYVNPTYQDNFPTTNLEALACGTPVITYNTGGSPEAIDEHTGFVVEKGDVDGIIEKIKILETWDRQKTAEACRKRAEKHFDKNKQYLKYLKIFEDLIKKTKSGHQIVNEHPHL
ncbi:MAG: glycosyltransferase [Ignavibacterium sp.]